MNTTLKAKIDKHLETDAAVIKAGDELKASGGSTATCIAYDAAMAAETASYEANMAGGTTREGWVYYDKQRAAMYRRAGI